MEYKIIESTDEEQNLLDEKLVQFNRESVPFNQKEDFINLNYVIKDDKYSNRWY